MNFSSSDFRSRLTAEKQESRPACKVQVDVMASGAELVIPKEEVIAELADFGRPPSDGPGDFVNRLWKALLRDLEKEDGSYKR